MPLKSTLTLMLMLSLMRCAHPDGGTDQTKPAATAEPGHQASQTPASSAAATAAEPLDQNAVTLWFQQRGVETRNLVIISKAYGNGPTAVVMPARIQFKTSKPSGDQEKWRLRLRDDFSAWLVQRKHPEGSCTSVDLKPNQDLLEVDIQIVCR